MFKITQLTKLLLIGITIITGISFLLAYIYYNDKNEAEDPRIIESKYLFKHYENLIKDNNFEAALAVLDSIDFIFNSVPAYQSSYEPGIVLNNRGSAYLSMALSGVKDSFEIKHLFSLAKEQVDSAITIYTLWLNKNGKLSKQELLDIEKQYFPENDIAFEGKDHDKILNKRIEDLILAQNETPRRLSVSYTNLGIILRHQYKQNEAVECYIKAIKLWKDNFTARNNFNVLMGKPSQDRSIIDQLFPPEKNKFN